MKTRKMVLSTEYLFITSSMLKKIINTLVCSLLVVSILYITACPVYTQDNGFEDQISSSKPSAGTIAVCFLDENNEISTKDIGKTMLTAHDYDNNTKYPLVTSEENDSGYIVRFMSLNHDEFDYSVSVSMNFGTLNNPLVFPNSIIREVDGNTQEYKVSPYDPNTETFKLLIKYDDMEDDLTATFPLNANIFTTYKDDPSLSASQNIRSRNMTVALGIAAVIELKQTEQLVSYYESRNLEYGYSIYLAGGGLDKAVSTLFKAIAVVAVVALVILAPPTALTIGGLALPLSGAIFTTTAAITAGITTIGIINGFEAGIKRAADGGQNVGKEEWQVITGKPGPAGSTILIDKANSGLPYHLELAPANGTFKTRYEALLDGQRKGFRLPKIDELARIWQLCFTHSMFSADKIAQGDVYVWVAECGDDYEIALWLPTGQFVNFHLNATALQYALVREYNP